MSTVYFDQNVYDFCADNIPVAALRKILQHKNHELVLGTLDLLEVAACFKSGNKPNIKRGKFLSQYFKSLLPVKMLRDISGLMQLEARKSIEKKPAESIYYSGKDRTLFEEEINKLSCGIYDKTASEFIERDWAGKIAYKQKIIDILGQAGGLNLKGITAMSFSDFMVRHKDHYEAVKKQWIRCELESMQDNWRGCILNAAVKRIVSRPLRYPCFTLGPKIDLFLFFKAGRDGTFSQDTPADLKHLISSTPIDIFVTGDKKLINYAKDICPKRIIYKTDEYFRQ